MVVLKFPYSVGSSVAKDLLANVNHFYGRGDAVMVTGYVAYEDGFGRIVQKEEISA